MHTMSHVHVCHQAGLTAAVCTDDGLTDQSDQDGDGVEGNSDTCGWFTVQPDATVVTKLTKYLIATYVPLWKHATHKLDDW